MVRYTRRVVTDIPKATHFTNEYGLPGGGSVKDDYFLYPKQLEFMQQTARNLLFGGARGPGKTVTLVTLAKNAMIRWPGIPILILRKDLQDLKRTTMREFFARTPKELYDPKYGGQWNKAENWVRFYTGSIAYFGELKDWESYKSMTLGRIYIDELNEIEEDAFSNLGPTLRWMTNEGVCDYPECKTLSEEFARAHPKHPRYQIVAASNPAPGWVKERWYDPWKEGRERPGYKFVPATSFDNPSLPPDFIANLMKDHTATWVQNFIYGNWESFENMAWPKFNRGQHLWRAPIPYASFVEICGGIDYGATTITGHRTTAYLTGLLPSGELLTFWEYSKQGAASEDFFATLKAVDTQFRVKQWWADSSQHRTNELLQGGNINVQNADRRAGAVKEGIGTIDRLMTPNAARQVGIYVAERECPRLISGIESYQIEPRTGEPTKNQDDDEVDAWRYNITGMTRARYVLEDRQVVTGVASSGGRRVSSSSILLDMKAARRARMAAAIARAESRGM